MEWLLQPITMTSYPSNITSCPYVKHAAVVLCNYGTCAWISSLKKNYDILQKRAWSWKWLIMTFNLYNRLLILYSINFEEYRTNTILSSYTENGQTWHILLLNGDYILSENKNHHQKAFTAWHLNFIYWKMLVHSVITSTLFSDPAYCCIFTQIQI